MGIYGLLLEDKKRRSGKFVEFTFGKLNSVFAGISIFILDEDLLFKVLNIREVGEENTFVEPQQLAIWTDSIIESKRVIFALGLHDWCRKIFEELQIFVFDDVICA